MKLCVGGEFLEFYEQCKDFVGSIFELQERMKKGSGSFAFGST